ncbi:MAG TPA: SET domain-containing protein [Burkholderiales bacterium]|nr:SET domain-containing protein [Burkholderiales bacterium]
MLLVRTRLAPSAIHGLGVFAAEPIARGAEVWRFAPGFDLDLDPKALEAVPAQVREWLLVYGYLDPRLQRFILCCDDARFINHSATPNLRPDFAREPHGVDLALRDVAPGEELTVDYALVDGILP